MTPIEITVKVSDDNQTLVEKFLHYPTSQELAVSHNDPSLKTMVDQTIAKFSGDPLDVCVKLKYNWV